MMSLEELIKELSVIYEEYWCGKRDYTDGANDLITKYTCAIRQSERAKAEGLVEALRDLIIEVERIGSTHKDILGFVINAKSALTKFNNEEK